MKQRIAIIAGARTPIGKSQGLLSHLSAPYLGAKTVRESLDRSSIRESEIDEVIIGNVSQPHDAANIARVIALKSGLPNDIIAHTVNRNCASGLQSITSSAEKILLGNAKIIVAGGVESMSSAPLAYNKNMVDFFFQLNNRKINLWQKIKIILSFRPHFLKPIITLQQALTDPVCGLSMGETAENLAKEFKISRQEQDAFALESHQKTIAAMNKNIFQQEIIPIPIDIDKEKWVDKDECPRENLSLEKLAKLKPFFDRKNGTVTVGNSCPVNDGAAAMILMSEKEAKKRKLKPLGFLKDYAYAGLNPEMMGLGPIYATAKLMNQNRTLTMKKFDLIEINEAFAAQVLANIRAFESDLFSKKFLNRTKALGKIDQKKLNVNGGAIAIGHPVGMSGSRIVLHALYEMKRRNKQNALATLCVGGGQGAAVHLQSK